MSFLERLPAEKTRAVSARVPVEIANEYDSLVKRVKSYGYTISLSKIIITALQNAIKLTNEELDRLPAPTTASTKARRATQTKVKASPVESGARSEKKAGDNQAVTQIVLDSSTFEVQPDREDL